MKLCIVELGLMKLQELSCTLKSNVVNLVNVNRNLQYKDKTSFEHELTDFIQTVSSLILNIRSTENRAKLNRKHIDDVMSQYILYEEIYQKNLKNQEEMKACAIMSMKNSELKDLEAVCQARDTAEATLEAAMETVNDHDEGTQATLKKLCSSLQSDVAGLKDAIVRHYRVYPRWKHDIQVDDLCCLQVAVSRLIKKEENIKGFPEEVNEIKLQYNFYQWRFSEFKTRETQWNMDTSDDCDTESGCCGWFFDWICCRKKTQQPSPLSPPEANICKQCHTQYKFNIVENATLNVGGVAGRIG